MLCHQVIHVHLKLQRLIIHIFAGCQNHSRVNFQGDVIGAAGNQYHAHNLHASAPLLQLRLIGFRAVGDGNHIAVFIKQTNFTDPPPAHVFGDHLFGNNMVGVVRVNAQAIERCASQLMYQRRLCRVRRRQYAVAVAYSHLGDLNLRTQCRGICQFRRAHIG